MSTLDNKLIKKPYLKEEYTPQQLMELAQCADPINGPAYFIENFFHIQHPKQGAMKYSPYEYQKRLLQVYHQFRYSISILPRQMGKSTTAAGYLLWYAMFVPDSTILVAAHKYAGSQEIMQRVRYAYEACPNHIRCGVVNYNKGSIEFDNGSRIVSTATTENTGRGMSISLLYLDEFAYVRQTIAKEFWASISPTLSTGGKALITSTPNTDEDQFAEIWKDANKCSDEFGNPTEVGRNGFKAFRAYWQEHPDRDDAWAREFQSKLGPERFGREIECEFITFEETLISPITLKDLTSREPDYKTGQVRWYQKPKADFKYFVGLDPSLGTGGDPAAIQVLEIPTLRQVGEWQHNKTRVQDQVKVLKEICDHIAECTGQPDNIFYSVENNSLGEAALLAISEHGEENIKGIFLSEPKRMRSGSGFRKGFTTTRKSKMAVCSKFKQLVENNKLKINSRNLISELKNFVANSASFSAKPGETDDLIMAMLLTLRMAQSFQSFDVDLDNAMRDRSEEMRMPMPILII